MPPPVQLPPIRAERTSGASSRQPSTRSKASEQGSLPSAASRASRASQGLSKGAPYLESTLPPLPEVVDIPLKIPPPRDEYTTEYSDEDQPPRRSKSVYETCTWHLESINKAGKPVSKVLRENIRRKLDFGRREEEERVALQEHCDTIQRSRRSVHHKANEVFRRARSQLELHSPRNRRIRDNERFALVNAHIERVRSTRVEMITKQIRSMEHVIQTTQAVRQQRSEELRRQMWLAIVAVTRLPQRWKVLPDPGPGRRHADVMAKRKDVLMESALENLWHADSMSATADRISVGTGLMIVRFGAHLIMVTARARKRKAAAVLQRYFKDLAAANRTAKAVNRFFHRIRRCQRMVRDFVACARARRELLERQWQHYEEEAAIVWRSHQNNPITKRTVSMKSPAELVQPAKSPLQSSVNRMRYSPSPPLSPKVARRREAQSLLFTTFPIATSVKQGHLDQHYRNLRQTLTAVAKAHSRNLQRYFREVDRLSSLQQFPSLRALREAEHQDKVIDHTTYQATKELSALKKPKMPFMPCLVNGQVLAGQVHAAFTSAQRRVSGGGRDTPLAGDNDRSRTPSALSASVNGPLSVSFGSELGNSSMETSMRIDTRSPHLTASNVFSPGASPTVPAPRQD